MPRLCANLTFLFTELPLAERFGAARNAGFEAVEILFPYNQPAPEILDGLAANGLVLAAIAAPPPNYAGGTAGFPAVPGGEERFRHDFRRSARYAGALGARMLQVMTGVAEGPAARATCVDNLRWAAAQDPARMLLIEPVNGEDMPGCFLDSLDLAEALIAEVGAPNLRLQFDTYHIQRLTGDAVAAWTRLAPLVGHLQLAAVPGRGEPEGGDIDWPAFRHAVGASGYAGWIGAEYHPRGRTAEGLKWMREW